MPGKEDTKANGNENVENIDCDKNSDSKSLQEEYYLLDSKLDDLNLALDFLEKKNNDIHQKLRELLKSNIGIRQELQNQNGQINQG